MEKKLRNRQLVPALILAAALLVRFVGMAFSPLEYDEIWTLENFSNLSVGRIFTDLALPNNHPLNSLFVKLWSAFVAQPQYIRLHSLVSGALSVALAGVLARGFFRSRSAALWSMFFMALSAPAAVYSGLARGYSLQLCFLLLFSCGLAWSGELRRFVPGRALPEIAMILGAAGAVLSVPSAPIFLAAAVVSSAVLRRRLPKRSVVSALALAALASAGYLAYNFSALREAQNWGLSLGTFGEWREFLAALFVRFVPAAALPLIASAALLDRKRSLVLLLCAILIVGSAAVFRAGPPRAYLPLCVLVALCCGRGVQLALRQAGYRRGRAFVSVLTLLAVLAGYLGYAQQEKRWEITDYWKWFDSVRHEPAATVVVFPAAEGYPLCWNNRPELVNDHLRRLNCGDPGERTLLVFSGPGRIGGMLPDGTGTELVMPFPGEARELDGRTARLYRLIPGDPAPGEPLLIILPPVPERLLRQLLGELSARRIRFVSLNPFFNYPVDTPGGVLRSRMLLMFAPESGAQWSFVRAAGGRPYRIAAPPPRG